MVINQRFPKLLMLPAPRLVVFFNGATEQPDEMILQLSDSFPKGSVSDIEVRVRMININYGRNQKLMEACKPLMEYPWLIAEVRKNKKDKEVEIGSVS